MNSITITVDDLGLGENLGDLVNRINEITSQSDFRQSVGEILVARARTTIEEGGNPLWAPIKQATIDRRWELEQKKKPSQRVNKQGIVSNAPLQRTGIGKQSLNYDLTSNGLTLKAARYMGYQQTGTKAYKIVPRNKKALAIPGIGPRKWANHPGIPARPFYIITTDDLHDIALMVTDDLRA